MWPMLFKEIFQPPLVFRGGWHGRIIILGELERMWEETVIGQITVAVLLWQLSRHIEVFRQHILCPGYSELSEADWNLPVPHLE